MKEFSEITTVNSLITHLETQHPTNHLVVFDKQSNGYCIDNIRTEGFTVSLVSNQECLEKTYEHFTVSDIIRELRILEGKFKVEIVINLPKPHFQSVINQEKTLFLEI